ncbi:MAG: lysophospholipid acyltransferase family protein [Desulfobacteraceae bacterium]|nr:lysophospholipid acyltransferase family protein [Desulfobacteraceae bacterium]
MNMSQTLETTLRGNSIGFWFFKTFLRFGGLYAAYMLLLGVSLHYWLFDKKTVKSSSAYLKRRFPLDSKIKIRLKVYKLIYSQGKQLLDRIAQTSGSIKFDIDFIGRDILNEILTSKKGFILLTAHAGNWQLAMTELNMLEKKIFLVILKENNIAVQKALKINNDNSMFEILSPEGHLGGIVPVVKELNNGNAVSYMGDRPYGFESLKVDFMNDKASFPYGAFAIAAATKVPIVTVLASKTGFKTYRVDFTNIIKPEYKGRKNKKNQLSEWVQEYADILNNFFEEYPYQCFLFHDVWENK